MNKHDRDLYWTSGECVVGKYDCIVYHTRLAGKSRSKMRTHCNHVCVELLIVNVTTLNHSAKIVSCKFFFHAMAICIIILQTMLPL